MVSKNAEEPIGTVQRATFSGPRHRAVRRMVLGLLPDAARSRGDDGRTGPGVDHSTIGHWVLRCISYSGLLGATQTAYVYSYTAA